MASALEFAGSNNVLCINQEVVPDRNMVQGANQFHDVRGP